MIRFRLSARTMQQICFMRECDAMQIVKALTDHALGRRHDVLSTMLLQMIYSVAAEQMDGLNEGGLDYDS